MASVVTPAAPLTSTTVLPEETKQFERQIVTIAGETVAFTPTGFPKGEPSIVQFDDYYKPQGLSLSDTMILKNALKQLFGAASLPVYDTKLGKELPQTLSLPILPPCDEIQKTLVMNSLHYRFDLLRQELSVRGIRSYQDIRKRMEELKQSPVIGSLEGKDSMDVRRNLHHFDELKKLIAKYDSAQQCFNLEDKAFGALELDLTDERARELLKQFIFFTLQAHHPLQEYKKTNPSAPGFVKRLELNPLGEKFPSFMTTYKGNKLPIPETIARVLESIQAQPGLLDEELKRRLEEAFAKEKQKILTYLYTFFPANDVFWRTVGEDKDVYRIVEKLMERLKEAEGEVDRLTALNADIEAKLKACESSKATLQGNLQRITEQVETLTRQLEAAGKKDEEIARLKSALDAATKDNQAKQQANLRRIAELEAELNRNLLLLQAEKERVAAVTKERDALRVKVNELQASEAAIKANLEEVRRGFEAQLQAEKGKTAAETSAKESALTARDTAVAELAAAKLELTGKDETLKANAEQIASLEKQLNDSTAETAKLRADISAKTEEAATLLREKTEVARRLATTEESLADVTGKLETSENKVEELQGQLDELNETLQQLRADLADKDAALKKCEAEKAAMVKPADELASKAASLEAALAEARSRAEATEAERARLESEVARLRREVEQRDGVVTGLQGELREKTDELGAMTGRAEVAEGELGTTKDSLARTTSELDEERAVSAKQREALVAKDAEHTRQIGELTETFQQQIAEETGKTSTEARRADSAEAQIAEETEKTSIEARRADSAEAKVGEMTETLDRQSRAYEALKTAIIALVSMEAATPEEEIAVAIDPVEEEDTKGNLKALYAKLLTSMTTTTSGRAAEKAAEHMASQCQNVLMLSFLWQTNFPRGDADSQALYVLLNTIFSSGPYPKRPAQKLPGVYEGNSLNAKIYLPLLKKLLTLFDFGSGNEGSGMKTRLTAEELTTLKKLLKAMTTIDEAYQAGKTSFMVTKARENLVKHQPGLEELLPKDSLHIDEASSSVERTAEAGTRLTYPVLFYCFMIVLRDVFNQNSESLSRGGQCPLPQILLLPAQRRGSMLSTLD
jgi:DNA repair exonuclease SbcCD ATPase subunit